LWGKIVFLTSLWSSANGVIEGVSLAVIKIPSMIEFLFVSAHVPI
jgi:hypothetical protein